MTVLLEGRFNTVASSNDRSCEKDIAPQEAPGILVGNHLKVEAKWHRYIPPTTTSKPVQASRLQFVL